MTFNQLFIEFKKRYGNTHDIIFFELLFFLSKIKNKEDFISKRNNELDFKQKRFWKVCNDYFIKEKPLAHIVGKTTFCGLEFAINKKVLSPREVTEQLVKDFIVSHKSAKGKLLDLCCGSGCIGISIKKHIPSLDVVCVDKYWSCIMNTHQNAVKHKTPLTIDCKDAIKYLNKLNSIDFLISNPPYINESNFKNIKMYKWESKKALIGADNGLYFYKKYFEWLNNHSFKEAWFEIGYDLLAKIEKLLLDFKYLKFKKKTNNCVVIINIKTNI